MIDPWFDSIAQKNARLKISDMWRVRREVTGGAGAEIVVSQRRVINLAGNDYLGLSRHPALIVAAKKAAAQAGTGSASSRLISGSLDYHSRLEAAVAGFKDAEGAIVFPTGYMANLGVITALAGAGDLILSDELNHASIVDACRLSKAVVEIYPHGHWGRVEELLSRQPARRRVMVVTDAVFSMDGDLAPLGRLLASVERYQALLVIDDAHGTGVLGERGRGTAEYLCLPKSRRLIQVGTFSKALGGLGGFVAGPEPVVQAMVQSARSFIYTTAPPPAQSAANRTALKIIDNEPWRRERVISAASWLMAELANSGYDVTPGVTPIIPVMIGSAQETLELSQRLFERGLFAPAARPPTVPQGKCRLRVSLSAAHTPEHLAKVAEVFYDLRPRAKRTAAI